MYSKIMVAIDGSESSKRALAEAVRLASMAGDAVHVVYVVDKASPYTYAGYSSMLHDLMNRDGRNALRYATETLTEQGVNCETELAETESMSEDIPTCLQRCAQRVGADLVVMGTHGRRGIRRMVLGSVAERFLRFSDCPVLMVRAEEPSAEASA